MPVCCQYDASQPKKEAEDATTCDGTKYIVLHLHLHLHLQLPYTRLFRLYIEDVLPKVKGSVPYQRYNFGDAGSRVEGLLGLRAQGSELTLKVRSGTGTGTT